MKKILLAIVAAIPFFGLGQGTTCADMDPICTDVGAQFTANTGTTAEAGNNYGCLLTQPNPSWYYFEIATNGNIDMSLTAPSDIDFIIWGPYPNLAAAQANCGTLGTGNQVDCSYSATNNETPSIPNAVVGQVYIMLVTNYANIVQDITLVQTGGSGSTDCSIVNNPPCFMSYFEANVSACDPVTGTYGVTGSIEFDDPPATGNLIVQDCNGNQVVVASAPFATNGSGFGTYNYNLAGLGADGLPCNVSAFFSADPGCSIMNLTYTAPECVCAFTYMSINQGACDPVTNTFTVSGSVTFESAPTTGTLTFTDCEGNTDTYFAPFTSPQTYSLPGITPNGTASCTVTATFSADPSCTMTSLPFSDPANCTCPVDIGTFTETTTGSTTAQYELCFGDSFTWVPNGDFIPHDDLGGTVGTPYLPGIEILLFDCPPSVQPPQGLGADPCLLGLISNSSGAGGWTVTNNTGDGLTFWYAPVSMYNWQTNTYGIIYSGDVCYDIGFAYPLTFLEEILQNTVEDCFAGTATTTVSGGTPAFNGSNFTVVPGSLTPTSATFVNTTCGNNGTITLGGLVDGDVYSYQIQDDNGCPITVSGTFQGLEDASFNYAFKYCVDDVDPLPTITGVPGGTFTASPAGMVINSSSGLIDLSATTPGIYTITYESPAATCWGTETFTLTINGLPVVNATEDSPICNDGISTINLGEDGGQATDWSWTTGGSGTISDPLIQNPVVSNATNGQTFTVTVTDVNTGCTNSDNVSVIVNPLDNPTFTLTNFCIGAPNAATITGTPGGTFSFNPNPLDGAVVNATTGEITNEVAGTTYNIQYTTNGACPANLTLPVTVNALPTVVTSDETICVGGSVVLTASGASTYTWSPGTYLNTTVGNTVTSTPGANIAYTITGTSAAGCQSTAVANVTVQGNAPINAGADTTICNGASATLTATGGVTYTWDQGLGVGNNFSVSPAATTTYTVTGQDANGCNGTDQVVITVNPVPTVNPVGNQTVCANTSTTGINFSGSVVGTTYNWTNSNATIGLAASGTGNIAAFTGINAGSTPVTATITVTPTANGCPGTPTNFTITVNPIPVNTPVADQTLCNGSAIAAVNFASGTPGTSYTWTNNTTSIGLAASGTGNIAAFNAVNNGANPVTATVIATPTANTCQGPTETFTITVNPSPIVSPVGNQTICNGSATTAVNFASTTAGSTFTWSNNTPSIGLALNGTGNIPSFNGVNSGTTPVTATITVTASANGCPGPSSTFTIVVNPTPTVNALANQTVCAGSPTTAVNFAGNVAGTTYDWANTNSTIGLGASGTGNIAAFNGVNATGSPVTGTITVTPTANACSGTPTNFTITVNPLPTGTINGSTNVCQNATAPTLTFTGSNGVAPYTFTYNINGTGSTQVVSVGNTATITVPTNTTGTFNYNLVSVTDASSTACSQNVAGTATVIVNPNPVPVITGTAAYCTGTSATLSTSLPYSGYVWSTGAVTPTVNVTIADNPITVTVTNANGCQGTSAAFNVMENTVIEYNTTVEICQGGSATIHGQVETVAGVYSQTYTLPTGCDSTSSVTLVVNPLPVIDAGADQTACEGSGITLNATGAPTIVWDVAGVLNGIQFFPAVGAVTYTATGTDANGCSSSDAVLVTINPTPSVDPITDQTVCNTSNTTAINFAGTVAGTTFAWTNDTPSIGLAANGNGPIGAFAGVNNGSTPVVATITVTPTANGCPGPSESFTITVNPTPTVDPILDQTVCNGTNTAAVNFGSATAGATYTWTNTTTSIGLAAAGSGNIAAFVGTNSTANPVTGTISVTPTANTCVGSPVDFAITINPSPVVDPIVDQTVCDGSPTAAVNFTSTTAGTSFSWSNSNTNIGLAASGNGNLASFNGTNSTGSAISGTITITPTAATCVGATESFVITVNPAPTVNAVADQTLCNGAASAAVVFASSTPGATFDWSNSNPAIGLGANGSGTIASFTATNAGASPISGVITVTPTANGCVGTPEDFTITVNPTPTVNAVANQALCDGSNTAVIAFASGTAGTTFDWVNDTPSIGLAANGSGNIGSFVATNNSGSVVVATIDVTPTANGCSGTPESFTITVNPAPDVDPILDDAVCAGDATLAVAFTSSIPGTTFDWVNNTPSIGLAGSGSGNIASFSGINNGAAPVTGTITVTPTANGCVGAAETFTITVNPLPNVFAGNDIVVCDGSTAILTATGAVNYAWSPAATNGQVFTPTATTTYTVIGTDANGCENSDDVTITVEPLPQVSFIADVTSGCAPLEVTFTNTTVGATNCIWTFGNGTSMTGCGSVTTTFDNGGLFDATLTTTSANGCVGTATYVDYIYVEDAPLANFVPSTSSGSFFNNQIFFDNNSSGAVTYVWDFGDGSPTSSQVNPIHTFPDDEAGTYEVVLTAYSPLGCFDIYTQVITINEELIFYVPNTFTPDNDDFNEYFQPVFSAGYDPFDFNLLIFNRWGEVIWESHNASVGWDGTYGADGLEVQDGTYTWKIDFKTTLTDERIMVVGHVNVLR